MSVVLPVAPMAPHAVTIDKIVAIVNNEVITENELDKRVAILRSRLEAHGVTLPPRHLLKRKVLSQMVLQRLELQYAHNIGIRVGKAQLKQAEESLAARNHMTVPQFEQAVASEGFTKRAFEKRLRVELTIRELVMRRISRGVVISHRAVSRFLAEARAADGTRYRVAEITLQVPVGADAHERQLVASRAQHVFAKIKAGEPFSQAAIAYSEDSRALQGGSLGWRTAARLRPRFVHALRRMKVGQVQVVSGGGAYYLIKLQGKRPGLKGPAQVQVRLREIVLRPSKQLTALTAREKLKALKARLLKGADFATLARAYSEGRAAKHGGLVGWVNVAALPPGLAAAARHLPLRTVGGPYSTAQGEALVEVVGRRVQSGMTRAEARRLLQMRKGNTLYVRWLQTLRDDAYVRYPGRSS